jgi:hypothetical protein
MDPLQCSDVPGSAVVPIVTAEHLIEMSGLLPNRQVPHSPHLILQAHQRAPQPVTFPYAAQPESCLSDCERSTG